MIVTNVTISGDKRLRRDNDVESLAGAAPPRPIIRPVEMTLLQDKVETFNDVTNAMRHSLNLCILLSNQRKLFRNSYTLRVCLLEHLFVRVIPLPLSLTHASRTTSCFWHTRQMRYETQADILRLLNLLCRHFATASLSVKPTRSGDAVRMLVFACMATICDATFRKVACDIPSQASLHYSGHAKGPVQPFGFELGNFAEESEYLKFSTPETAAARSLVLDYFYSIKRRIDPPHMMFTFYKGNELSPADKLFIDQICLQMGFPRGCEAALMSGVNRSLLDIYPEIGYFRDLVFMFNLVMVPSSEKLPEIRPWDPHEAELNWSAPDNDKYAVQGFEKKLECTQEVSVGDMVKQSMNKGFFSKFLKFVGLSQSPRSTPSQANPSILLHEDVDNEDDILHVRSLPDFDGTLGGKDCELMLQYLTAPYLRIPLLLHFFSSELRLRCLRHTALQEILDAAIFEPGQWKPHSKSDMIFNIPAPDRGHLCTPSGLLFNEIIKSPHVILDAIYKMLSRVVDMDTGKYSELSDSILYVARLAVRIEGYLLFVVKNNEYHKGVKAAVADSSDGTTYGAYTASAVRGIACTSASAEEALKCQMKLRDILHTKVFPILAKWTIKAKADGKVIEACMLHAHLAYLFRNVEAEELDCRIVFTMLASQIYLFNNYRYDLDVQGPTKDKKEKRVAGDGLCELLIPEVELFDMYQRNRLKIVTWLKDNSELRDAVMDGVLHMIEGEKESSSRLHVTQQWMCFEQKGFSFAGRYWPKGEVNEKELIAKLTSRASCGAVGGSGDGTFEGWLRDTSTLVTNTEINVQLGEFTVKKNIIQPLPKEIIDYNDFKIVFPHVKSEDIIQCADVKITANRRWMRMVGLGYDLLLWSPDDRRAAPVFRKSYEQCTVPWIKSILEPWKEKALSNVDLFLSTDNLANLSSVLLQGVVRSVDNPDVIECLKEVIIYRYPKVVHVFNVVEYGRRWYRTQVFSSDPVFSFHNMESKGFHRLNKYLQYSGDAAPNYQKAFSLVITRDGIEDGAGHQTFLPTRFLHGIVPTALLSKYKFWQNASDDCVIGYTSVGANKSMSRSILQIDIKKTGQPDSSGFNHTSAVAAISRFFIQEPTDNSLNISQIEFFNKPDPSKPKMYLLNLLKIMEHYKLQFGGAGAVEGSMSNQQAFKDLLDFQGERSSLHGLIRLLIRMETFSHILPWTLDKQAGSDGVVNSVDLIELPRLHLSFEKVRNADGTIRYRCVEHAELYITGFNGESRLSSLLSGLPRSVLLANSDMEEFVLLPATARPSLLKGKVLCALY